MKSTDLRIMRETCKACIDHGAGCCLNPDGLLDWQGNVIKRKIDSPACRFLIEGKGCIHSKKPFECEMYPLQRHGRIVYFSYSCPAGKKLEEAFFEGDKDVCQWVKETIEGLEQLREEHPEIYASIDATNYRPYGIGFEIKVVGNLSCLY